ncbi:MAG: glycine cleavage system protein GcvH [Thermodesulfobacteriota bacterium]|nr:glycine cleavage system protein GcvH [Thermodesulfobacteriota bacterium]
MEKISELNFPDNLRYTEDHEWAKQEGEQFRIGISDYAQNQLGDIVFAELPQIGDTFAKGAEFGTIESVKAVSELYMPVGGEIVAINETLEDAPELVNNEPYAGGWMIVIKPSDINEFKALLDHDAYLEILKG